MELGSRHRWAARHDQASRWKPTPTPGSPLFLLRRNNLFPCLRRRSCSCLDHRSLSLSLSRYFTMNFGSNFIYVFIFTDGKVITWGRGTSGQLGHGDMVSSLQPKRVKLLDGFVITHVSAGWSHSGFVSGFSLSLSLSFNPYPLFHEIDPILALRYPYWFISFYFSNGLEIGASISLQW